MIIKYSDKVAKIISDAMQDKGVSQADIVSATGIDKGTISKIVHDEREQPKLYMLFLILKYLGFNAGDIRDACSCAGYDLHASLRKYEFYQDLLDNHMDEDYKDWKKRMNNAK